MIGIKSASACTSCPLAAPEEPCVFLGRERPTGEVVYAEGAPATTVWLVRTGAVVLWRVAGGGERPQGVRRGGGLIGLEALVRDTYLDTARVAAAGRLCAAPRGVVEAWLGVGGPARLLLTRVIEGQAAEPPRMAGPAVCRVASWLLAGPAEPDGSDLPRHTIARLLGLVPETLSRALAELAGAGAIDVSRRSITIRERGVLAALARDGVHAPGEPAAPPAGGPDVPLEPEAEAG